MSFPTPGIRLKSRVRREYRQHRKSQSMPLRTILRTSQPLDPRQERRAIQRQPEALYGIRRQTPVRHRGPQAINTGKLPYCLFELWTVIHELQLQTNRSLLSVVIAVEHRNSNITTDESRKQYLEYWETFSGTPTELEWPPEKLKAYSN